MIELCAAAHPYYQRVFRDMDLAPADFGRVEDLRKLPVLRKEEYARDPEMFRLRLDGVPDLSVEETTLADIIYTTGSSGAPAPFYDTMHDRLARIDHIGRVSRIAGIGPEDTVMNLFPLSARPHQGLLSAMWGSMAVGSKLLSGMTGRPYDAFPVHNRMDDAIDIIERGGATVLWGITTYVRRLVMRAQELGKDFSSVRLAMLMGEPCPPGMREDIRSRLRALGSREPVTNNGYGFTESQAPAIECIEMGGRHIAAPEQYYYEVVGPETLAPLPDGEAGLLLVSHLDRRGTVLLRYAVGDLVAMTHEACRDCGRSEPRFLGSPRRADEMTKVKGTLMSPAAVQERLASALGHGLVEYQMVIACEDPSDPYSADRMLLRLACAHDDRAKVGEEVTRLVAQVAEITPQLEFLPADGFAEIANGYKFERFVDERDSVRP